MQLELREAALRDLIDGDRATGIAASRKGKINRRHYAHRLGCLPSSLTPLAHVFAEYEKELGITTGPMRRFPEMTDWLRISYEERRLAYIAGKLDRSDFAVRFGLKGGAFMARYPAIRKLFEEYDSRARREGYVPAAIRPELNRLQAALADNPTLNKDRLRINQIALAEAIQVSLGRFRDPLFARELESKEAEILEAAKASKIDPYLHERVWPFSPLGSEWSHAFLTRIGVKFKQGMAGANSSTAKHVYIQLSAALSCIGNSADECCRRLVAEAKERSRISNVDDWEEGLHVYRDQMLSRISKHEAKPSTVDKDIKSLRAGLRLLATGKIVPETSIPLAGIKNARRRGHHLRSVAEASSRGRTNADEYVAFARDRLLEVQKAFVIQVDTDESKAFLEGLAAEIERSVELPADVPSAVRLLLERRLEALRTTATAILEQAVEAWERGQELMAMATIDVRSFESEFFGRPPSVARRRLMRRLFPDPAASSDTAAAQGLANLLRLIDERHGGIPPIGGTNEVGPAGQFFAKRYLEYGGLATVEPLLNPAPNVVGASLTLYLVESGSNVSVGRTLPEDCSEASDVEGYRRVTGNKAKAKGKPIIVDFQKDSPAIRAIEWLRSASERLRSRAGDDSDRLFLMRIGNRIQLMTPHWYTDWFKHFAASSPGLEGLSMTPNMMRPSVLLHVALCNDGRLATGMALGQHGLAVSQGYQSKYPTRLLYEDNMRRFLAAYETLVVSGIEDAAKKLGISAEQFKARLGNLRPTGLGTFCKDQRGRLGQDGGRCPTMDCWNECPNLMIVAEVEAIAALQLWQSSLRVVQPEWERDRPERWDQVWLPWLCLTDVVEEKMVRGPSIKIWKAASDLAAKISARANYAAPRPW